MREILEEIKAYVIEVVNTIEGGSEFHIMLEHSDGEREISYQHWPTRTEAQDAIIAYAKDKGADIQRAH